MPQERLNPYEITSNQKNENPYRIEQVWNGRHVVITGGLRSKSLWMVVGYTITIDRRETFETASLALTEDFTWRFRHNGRDIEGNFRTKGINNGISRRFDLRLDNEYIGNFKIRLEYWWVPYLMLLVPVVMLICVYVAIKNVN